MKTSTIKKSTIKNSIVWTIAGSDCGGGAGIQADLHTFQALGVYGCSIITALTAQNSVAITEVEYISEHMLQAQINCLANDLPATALKLGMLGATHVIDTVATFLEHYSGYVVCDPVMVSSTGTLLFADHAKTAFIQKILPRVDLLTPNLAEAQALLGCSITTSKDIETAAQQLLAMGCKNVLIKGGHGTDKFQGEFQGDFCQDYWSNGTESFWLTIERRQHADQHGSGCTLSAAITAAIARGYCLADALVIAKAYVSQGIRFAQQYGKGPGPVAHLHWPDEECDLPWLTQTAAEAINRPKFQPCKAEELGFYLIVDSCKWLEQLLPAGVKTLQLRIKNLQGDVLETEIKRGIELAKQYNARLFINDYWQLAIKHGAYGVHLGQGDLADADFAAIARAGLRLGISTHCYYEVARAHAYRPSYIACGPIYETTAKIMPFAPQGISNLNYWRKLLNYPLVAIGGISKQRLADILATGVEGVAVISAVLNDPQPEAAAKYFLTHCAAANN